MQVYLRVTILYIATLFLFPYPTYILTGNLLFAQESDTEDFLNIGGALRFNYFFTEYDGQADPNDVQFTFDTWRINITGQKSGVGINFEYRFYPAFNTHFIKQGWFDYSFSEQMEIQVGVTQVPFGNLQYNSHNWWFQGGYYMGLEDDHDMGFKLIHRRGPSTFMAAYFVQPEPSGPAYGTATYGIGGPGRYSYDVVPVLPGQPWGYVLDDNEAAQSNQEKNQFNLRYTYALERAAGTSSFGVSGQLGRLYNSAVNETRSHSAAALHADLNFYRFNIKAQYALMDMDPVNDLGNPVDYVYMGAYGDPYRVARRISLYSIGVSYSLDTDLGPVSNLTFYDDYTYMKKEVAGFNDSHQHVLGVLATVGDMYIYFDIASGMNHPWINPTFGTGLAQGEADPRINTRFNINIGYYF